MTSLSKLSASGRMACGLPHRPGSRVGMSNRTPSDTGPDTPPIDWTARRAAVVTAARHALAPALTVDTTRPPTKRGLGWGLGVPLT
jgi:hypothetical protein